MLMNKEKHVPPTMIEGAVNNLIASTYVPEIAYLMILKCLSLAFQLICSFHVQTPP